MKVKCNLCINLVSSVLCVHWRDSECVAIKLCTLVVYSRHTAEFRGTNYCHKVCIFQSKLLFTELVCSMIWRPMNYYGSF